MAASRKQWDVLAACAFGALAFVAVASSSSSGEPPEEEEKSTTESVEAQIRALLPPATAPTMDPTADATIPYDPLRTPESDPRAWQYEDLSPEEQEVADKGFDTASWDKAHSVYVRGAAEQYLERAQLREQYMLGVTELDTAGVVP